MKYLVLGLGFVLLTACNAPHSSAPVETTPGSTESVQLDFESSSPSFTVKPTDSETPDLTNCRSYFDGCNTCMVDNGEISGCTRKYCPENTAEPMCLEYDAPPLALEVGANGGLACENAGGTWDQTHLECTGIGAAQCEKIGGFFNECASACRHDPAAEICTMQCVLVCEFVARKREFTSPKGTALVLNNWEKNPRIFSPLRLTGQVDSAWVFEGNFRLDVLDQDKNVLKEHYGTANIWDPAGEPVLGLVDFTAEVAFAVPAETRTGFLRLGNSNASGLPENDDWIDIPVGFR